ncbi:uncharacterized protein ColSpa_10728 [Colletotrichum spaethianum]|uniref:Uncharacterized protein n=1 Tax=Colletotrichum spaethianum TaxID=700344 RepID=A0AA37PE86_9PEZI|nr:uncharacterized protein ColSpa_10728 [Colletotrichum spaethianum]GKT50547.1 hypothetical protein ColSpa_10728 [Colletotrichum spaethianum]
MSSNQEPIGQWVEKWNQLVFFQPDDQLSAKTLQETLHPETTVKINHDVHDIKGLTGGVQWVRTAMETTLESNEELVAWNAPDGLGGSVAHLTKFSSKDKASGKVTKKTSLVTTIVKAVDGKRLVSELIEVEVET